MTPLLATLVDTKAMGKIVLAGIGGGVAFVAVFAFAVVGVSRATRAREQGSSAVAPIALAGVCLIACAGALALGVWAMTQKP